MSRVVSRLPETNIKTSISGSNGFRRRFFLHLRWFSWLLRWSPWTSEDQVELEIEKDDDKVPRWTGLKILMDNDCQIWFVGHGRWGWHGSLGSSLFATQVVTSATVFWVVTFSHSWFSNGFDKNGLVYRFSVEEEHARSYSANDLNKLRTVPLVKTASASVCRIEPPGMCQKETKTGKVPSFAWCLVWNGGVKVSNDTLLVLCICLGGLKQHFLTIVPRCFLCFLSWMWWKSKLCRSLAYESPSNHQPIAIEFPQPWSNSRAEVGSQGAKVARGIVQHPEKLQRFGISESLVLQAKQWRFRWVGIERDMAWS